MLYTVVECLQYSCISHSSQQVDISAVLLPSESIQMFNYLVVYLNNCRSAALRKKQDSLCYWLGYQGLAGHELGGRLVMVLAHKEQLAVGQLRLKGCHQKPGH